MIVTRRNDDECLDNLGKILQRLEQYGLIADIDKCIFMQDRIVYWRWQPRRNFLTSGLGLDDMSLVWPAVVQLLFFIYSGAE